MKTRKIKSAGDIKLVGITAAVRFVDGGLKQVTLTDGQGGLLIVEQGQYSDFVASVPAPPEMVKKFQLSGTVLGLPVNEIFGRADQADRRKEGFESHGRGRDPRDRRSQSACHRRSRSHRNSVLKGNK